MRTGVLKIVDTQVPAGNVFDMAIMPPSQGDEDGQNHIEDNRK